MQLISGAFLWRLKAERGFPLDMALQVLAGHDFIPKWDELFAAAHKDGVNLEKLARDLLFFVRESYSAEVYAACATNLPLMPEYTYRKAAIESLRSGQPGCSPAGSDK